MAEFYDGDDSGVESGAVETGPRAEGEAGVETSSDSAAGRGIETGEDDFAESGPETGGEGEAEITELPEVYREMEPAEKEENLAALNDMTPEEQDIYYDAVAAEPALTENAREIAEKTGGTLEGLDARIKTPASVHHKAYREDGKDVPVAEMCDIVRYTEVHPPEKLADGANNSMREYENRGYKVDKVKNTWDDENTTYRGINARLTSPEGQKFEVQYHTPESFDLKSGEVHVLYKETDGLSDRDPRKAQLKEEMAERSAKLPRPDRIDEVKNK